LHLKQIISYKVPTGFLSPSSLATFSSAGGHLEFVETKNRQKDLLTAI